MPRRSLTEINRETLAQEADEWFDEMLYPEGEQPPAWLWMVFYDAGIYVADILEVLEGTGDVIQFSIDTVEQIQNASTNQIACYAKAREAWVEQP